MQNLPKQAIEYTKFNKVRYIRDSTASLHARELFLTYGPDQQRVSTVYKIDNAIKKTKYFALGQYEKEIDSTGNARELYYISGPDGVIAILHKMNNQDSIFYIHKDYLGSYDVISKADGTVKERNNFDPWGRRRNPADWSYDNVSRTHFIDRGFTGHEHLDQFGLINMNGRVYDPLLAMFLSPDNNLQSPDFTQNFNRYAYCLNNPLRYVDPSGNKTLQALIDDLWDFPNGGTWNSSGNSFTAFGPDSPTLSFNDGQYGFWINNSYLTEGPSGVIIGRDPITHILINSVNIRPATFVPISYQANPFSWTNNSAAIRDIFFPNTTSGEGGGETAEMFNHGIEGFGTGAENLTGSFRLTNGSYNGSQVSLKYYNSGWKGGSSAGISTYSATEWGGRVAKGSIIVSVGFGAYNIYNGVQEDGGTYGINAQVATGQTVGGIAGGWAGAEAGATAGLYVGAFFGPAGLIAGPIVGGIIGGVAGGWAGSTAGEGTVLQIHR
jgi:RHS repeat-associated protein